MMLDKHPALILGSSSKYRRELLEKLKIPFFSISPNVDESSQLGESPSQLAIRLSIAKARAVHSQHREAVVIGADQVACLNGRPVGKPGTLLAARQQLSELSGQTVLFHSALTVIREEKIQTISIPTTCVFRHLSQTAIARYVQIDHPIDTAGSAKAESLGIALMERISSDDPTAIIGLPLIALTTMLRNVGLDPLEYESSHE